VNIRKTKAGQTAPKPASSIANCASSPLTLSETDEFFTLHIKPCDCDSLSSTMYCGGGKANTSEYYKCGRKHELSTNTKCKPYQYLVNR